MNRPAAAGDEFERRLHRGAVIRLTLDKTTLDDPGIDERSKYVVVVSALLPDDDVWFVMCMSKSDHFDKNTQFANEVLRWVPGAYAWCTAAPTIVDCTKAHKLPTSKLRDLYQNGQLKFMGDIRPAHLARIDDITKTSNCLSPEEKRWIVPW